MSASNLMRRFLKSLAKHPVYVTPPTGSPYVLGLWHRDRASLQGYWLELKISAKSLLKRRSPKKFLILARPRSGTELLVRLLNQIEGLECYGETLHHAVWNPVRFLENHACTRNAEVTGSKLLTYQMLEVQKVRQPEQFCANLRDMGFRFIHLTRNTFDQCVSLSVAQKSGIYHLPAAGEHTTRRITLDPKEFVRQVRWNLATIDFERQLLADLNPLHLQYDRCLKTSAEHQATIDRVAAWLDHPASLVEADLERTRQKVVVENLDELRDLIRDTDLSVALRDG